MAHPGSNRTRSRVTGDVHYIIVLIKFARVRRARNVLPLRMSHVSTRIYFIPLYVARYSNRYIPSLCPPSLFPFPYFLIKPQARSVQRRTICTFRNLTLLKRDLVTASCYVLEYNVLFFLSFFNLSLFISLNVFFKYRDYNRIRKSRVHRRYRALRNSQELQRNDNYLRHSLSNLTLHMH